MEERQSAIPSFTPQEFWTLAVDTPLGPIQLHRYDATPYTTLATESAAGELVERIQKECPTVMVESVVI